MAKHTQGKHVKAKLTKPKAVIAYMSKAKGDDADSKDDSAKEPKELSPEQKHARRVRILKRTGIGLGIAVCVCGAVYLGGVALFATHFMPNTHISDIDISFKTPAEVQQEFENKVSDYTFKVKGKGLNIEVTSSEAGLNIDSIAMTDAAASKQNPWKWPAEVLETHDFSDELTNVLSATHLSEVVQAAVDDINKDAADPQNARIDYSDIDRVFVITPEVNGTKLNFEAVLADIFVGAMNLDPQVIITNKDLIQPDVFRDDERLAAQLSSANNLIQADFILKLGGAEASHVDAETIHGWVVFTPEFGSVINEDLLNDWARELAPKFNTVGTKRTYTRPDGKTITVSGGDYGWKVDTSALASRLTQAVKEGFKGEIDIPVLQSGNGFSGVGSKDWGSRYIDVDLSQQYARFYDYDGNIIWESAIVSGLPRDGRATPQGVYDLNSKGTNVTLVGSDTDKDGKPDYETPVKYWMPFKGNSVGFHDASWQPTFGGSRYLSGGSHGCVNLPPSKAESLYSLIRTGDVVVVHS